MRSHGRFRLSSGWAGSFGDGKIHGDALPSCSILETPRSTSCAGGERGKIVGAPVFVSSSRSFAAVRSSRSQRARNSSVFRQPVSRSQAESCLCPGVRFAVERPANPLQLRPGEPTFAAQLLDRSTSAAGFACPWGSYKQQVAGSSLAVSLDAVRAPEALAGSWAPDQRNRGWKPLTTRRSACGISFNAPGP